MIDAIPFTVSPGPIYGPWLVVVVLSWTLWGFLTLQVASYYYQYKRDCASLKWLVSLHLLADTAHKIILLAGGESYVMRTLRRLPLPFQNKRELLGLAPVHHSNGTFILQGETAPRVFVTILVQGFCFSRVYKFARRTHAGQRMSPLPAGFISDALLCLLACLIVTFTATDAADFASKTMMISAPGYLGTALGTDVTMAGLMTFFLYQEYRNGHYEGTNNMLRRLCLFSVNTGTWTAVFALTTLVLYERRPSDNYWAIFDFGVCGVYSNTLLANLNARDFARGDDTATFTLDGAAREKGRALPPLRTRETGTRGTDASSAETDASLTPRDIVTFVAAKEGPGSPARTDEGVSEPPSRRMAPGAR
ncbi:hypothetical protein HDZ31DRAFT_45436 [Schizophyllum fasciatum]